MIRAVLLTVVLALVLAACATGGPAATGGRLRCAEDRPGATTPPLVFAFCLQSP